MARLIKSFPRVWVVSICFLIGLGDSQALAQSEVWKRRISTDRRFSVELPAPLKRVPIFEAELGVYKPDKPFLDTAYFVANEVDLDTPRFAVIVLGPKTVRAAQRISRKEGEKSEDVLERLATFHMTDDDSGTELSLPKKVTMNGLRGTEYTYEDPSLFTRGIYIKRGSRIYFLIFVGKDAVDLASPTANRFFNSFKVRRTRQR